MILIKNYKIKRNNHFPFRETMINFNKAYKIITKPQLISMISKKMKKISKIYQIPKDFRKSLELKAESNQEEIEKNPL